MLQETLRDWHVRSTKASVSRLHQMIDRSPPPDGDDAVLMVDVLLTTAPDSASPDVISDWVVARALEVGLPSVERHADPLIDGVACWRARDGTAISSIPQRHVHYAPMGVDWGYGDSGPADLALNVLALFLPLASDAIGVALRDGSSVSEAAWVLHQEFKYDLIVPLPRSGGHIPAKTIRAWITTHPIVEADPLLSPHEQRDGGPHVALGR